MLLLYAVLFLLDNLVQFSGCTSLVGLLSSIAVREHKVRPEGLEVCVLQLREYTDRSPVDDTVRTLVKLLATAYPVTITRHGQPVSMYVRRDASLVLMDATGFGVQFPADLVLKRLKTHECYSKSAKFITIVDASTNVSAVAELFADLGVLNYLTVPVHVPTGGTRNGSQLTVARLYSRNQFSGQEYLFDIRDHTSSTVDRYFPNKLANVHGYKFFVAGLYEFPYLISLPRRNRTVGLLVEAMRRLIQRKLNGTLTILPNGRMAKARLASDITFDYLEVRMHFMHDFTLLERGGTCLLCPFRTERDFMGHLLKPFSVGIWLVLGGLFVVCTLLGRLCPQHFHPNLVELIFLGASVSHQLTFPTRALSFAVALFIFFLSEAYNARIVSLMSISKYHERPETVRELNQSALKIANPGVTSSLLAEQLPGKVLSLPQANRVYRERGEMMFNEYCTVDQCHMAMLFASDVDGHRGFLQYVMREQLMQRLLTLQLAAHSPFHQTLVEFMLRYYQSGVWMYRADGLRNELRDMVNAMLAQFTRVVFHFEDLVCVWVLIMVGWLAGGVCFTAELLVAFLVRTGKCKCPKM